MAPARFRRAVTVTCLTVLALLPGAASADPLRVEPVGDITWQRPGLVLELAARLEGTGAWAESFGGLSGLHVAAERVTALSDRGHVFAIDIDRSETGAPVSITGLQSQTLCGAPGAPRSGREADAEALAQLEDGSWLVAFERVHRIEQFGPEGLLGCAAPRQLTPPPGVDALVENTGMEALALDASGGLWVLSEDPLINAPPETRALWHLSEGAWREAVYLTEPEFRPTDTAFLPDGDLVVLERRFSPLRGVGIRLMRVAAEDLGKAELRGTLMAEIAPPLPLDNYEGLAVDRTGGATRLWLVADDNYSEAQESWLLILRLVED